MNAIVWRELTLKRTKLTVNHDPFKLPLTLFNFKSSDLHTKRKQRVNGKESVKAKNKHNMVQFKQN